MPRIHVCSLSRVPETVRAVGAKSLVTLINAATHVPRPPEIAPDRHLFVGLSDITEQTDGHILPESAHIAQLLTFIRRWDRAEPLVIHCYAGVSRSTAAAYIAYCALHPDADERATAQRLRALSPSATPNARLVALGDVHLRRDGRMIAAIADIGRGRDCFEGEPFALDIARRENA
ncbi:MAG: protein tyrosine phosphatase [Hyphomicrobiales bacterium]|nr:protein tyrosine phosphatase [Hyphomicrobiales bacterium]